MTDESSTKGSRGARARAAGRATARPRTASAKRPPGKQATAKTRPTDADPAAFVAAVADPRRRADAETLLALCAEVTGAAPELWGSSIVGFGRWTQRHASGREAEWMRTGFSPRARRLVVYVMPGFDGLEDLLGRLGPHETGASCLYIKRLADVDETVLREIVAWGWRVMGERHGPQADAGSGRGHRPSPAPGSGTE